jgi:hypothetical protein
LWRGPVDGPSHPSHREDVARVILPGGAAVTSMDDDWAFELSRFPEGPADTHDCIYIKRALKEIELRAGGDPDRALKSALDGIEQGKLALRCRLYNATEGIMAELAGWFRTREVWADSIARGYVMARDVRDWVPIAERRRIRQPHWLFVTRESLKTLLEELPSTAGAEHSATIHVASLLKGNRDLKRDEAKAECERFGLSEIGFLTRVWPRARELADLPARARAGRKKSKT